MPHTGGSLGQGDLLDTIRAAVQDRYAVVAEIGRGGMATVYHATDLRHRRSVALKLLFPELARAVGGERFLREISILARLSHPNILPLLDSGTVEVVPGLPVPWYVMPFVADDSLRVRLSREGPLPLEAALRYTRDLCSALAHAHGQGYIHRDIKPENILLQGDHAVLADFGIARAVTVAGGGTLSSSGLVVGTPTYMSPEQSVGSDKLDARSDLYSLGCVLYEMLAGQPPFTGATPQAISARHQFEPLPPIRVVRPAVPERVERLLGAALAKTPADRIGSAQEFERQLAEAQQSGEVALDTRPRTAAVAHRAWWRRGWRGVAAVAVGLVGAGLGAALLVGGSSIEPQRIAVLPFTSGSATPPQLLSGADAAQLVSDRLSDFQGLARVDAFTLQGALEESGSPQSLRQAVHLARTLGAGRLIWGQIYEVGDSLRIRAVLYRVSRWGYSQVAEQRVGLPLRGDSASNERLGTEIYLRLGGLATRLLAPGDAENDEPVGTSSYAALMAKSAGDSALGVWNLELARSHYRDAIRLDPAYSDPNLKLAQIGQWLEEPASDWRGYASTVLARKGGVDSTTYRQVAGLLALADSNYPGACEYYRQMIARDSADFTGWFGLGECQRLDPIVIADASGRLRYGFRASLSSAQSAYLKALRLVPLSHRAFHDVLFPRLLEVFPTSTWLRSGTLGSDIRQEFLAWPEREADTSAYHPQPYALFAGQHPPPRPTSSAVEFERNRATLKFVVSDWVARYPSSPAAWHAKALMLERFERTVADTDGALEAITRALALRPDSATLLELLVTQTRMELKVGRFEAAGRSARAALASVRAPTGGRALQLAPLAALTGQTTLCVNLLRRGAARWTFTSADGTELAAPEDLAADALAYYGYAVMGGPPDSIRALERRVLDGITGWAPIQRRNQAISALMGDPAYYAFPVVGPSTAHWSPGHSASLDVQVSLARRDLSSASRAAHATLALADSSDAGELPPESAYLLSTQLLAVGDRADAAKVLNRLIGSLRLQDHLLLLPQASGFLVRGMELRRALAPRWVDSATARNDSLGVARLRAGR